MNIIVKSIVYMKSQVPKERRHKPCTAVLGLSWVQYLNSPTEKRTPLAMKTLSHVPNSVFIREVSLQTGVKWNIQNGHNEAEKSCYCYQVKRNFC